MPNKILPKIKYLVLGALGAISIAACSSGSCDNGNNPLPPPPNELALEITAPDQYPAGVPVPITAYLTLTNVSNTDAKDLFYAIPNETNHTGVTITVANDSSNPCKNIPAQQSCTFPVVIGANAHPGSFSVTATPTVDTSVQKNLTLNSVDKKPSLKSGTLTLTANIGLTDLPPNSQNGANGISFLYSKTISASSDGSTNVAIVAVVNSASAGNFNTINLTDAAGDLLDFNVLSMNSGSGLTNLTQGSIVTFLLKLPAGNSGVYNFYAQTMENGSLVDQGTTANPINLANAANGILIVQPTNFNLYADNNYTTQVITYTNIGKGTVNNLVIDKPVLPLVLTNNSCNSTLGAGQSCTIILSSEALPGISGSGSLVANYNNGVGAQATVSQYNYAGHDPVEGISLTAVNNFEFEANTINTVESTEVTLTNTGNVLESNFIFSFDPDQHFTLLSGSGANYCTVSGNIVTNQLAKNQSCILILQYSNESISSGITDMEVKYNFNGSSIGSSNKTLSYSTVQAAANFGVSPASPYVFNAIPANNVAFESVTFTYTNNGPDVASEIILSPISGTDSAYFSVVNSPNDCASATNIPIGGTCTIAVKFGPSSTAKQNLVATLSMMVSSSTGGSSTSNVALSGSVLSPGMAVLSAVNNTALDPLNFGFLSSTSPYWLNPNTDGILKFTITNTGTGTANDLIYRIPGMGGFCPIDAANTTCGSDFGDIKTSTLPVGQSCVLQFKCNAPSGQLTQGSTLGTFTYNDEARPNGTAQLPEITPFNVNIVTPATVSATMSSESSGTDPITSVGIESDFYIVYKLSNGYNVQNMTYGVDLTNAQGGTPPISVYPPNTCTLSSVNPSCYIKLNSGGAATDQSIGYTTTGNIAPNPESSGLFNVAVKYWSFVGDEQITNFAVYPVVSLAFDSLGTPYVAYKKTNSPGGVKKFDGLNWVDVCNSNDNLPVSDVDGTPIDLAINPLTNEPYIAFSDKTFTNMPGRAHVMKCSSGSSNWTDVGAAGFGGNNTAFLINIAFPKNSGTPYVVYATDNTSCPSQGGGVRPSMRAYSYNGSSWSAVGNQCFGYGNAKFLSLAFSQGSSSVPYVGYAISENFSGANRPAMVKLTGSTWTNVQDSGASDPLINYDYTSSISVAFPSESDMPYLAYAKASGSGQGAKILAYDGSWVNVGGMVSTAGGNNIVSLAFESGNPNPYLAYSGGANGGVSEYDGSSWNLLGANLQMNYPSLAFNPLTNKPYVAFANPLNTYTLSVIVGQ